jgi:Cu-processing system permease protein
MITQLATIARLELTATARLRWIRLLAAACALLSLAAAYSAGAAEEMSGADGFARTTTTLIPVVLLLVPLAALVLGVSGQAAETGSHPFLLTQPVSRATVLVGRWLGESAALAGAIVAGLAAGGVVVASNGGAAGLAGFAIFIAASIALGVVFLAVAAAIAATTERRITALGVATFVWFFFVLLYDGAALSAAVWLTGARGGRLLFASVFGNPTDLIRVATLSFAGAPNVLGAPGDAWLRFLGGSASAAAAAIGALAVWMIVPLVVGARIFERRDL